jgi:uncharacterized protein
MAATWDVCLGARKSRHHTDGMGQGIQPPIRALVPVFLGLLLGHLSLVYATDLPRTKVEVRRPATGVVLLVVDAELATTAESRTHGLMERASLPDDRGMLFVFETAQPLSFWMFNTLIPLDMIFADAQRRVTTIHAAVPPCRPPARCPSYASDGLAQFVLEVNAGTAAKAGIAIGDELRWGLP